MSNAPRENNKISIHSASDALSDANSTELEIHNWFSGNFRKAVENLPEYLKTASEIELSNHATPTPTDYGLRQRITELIAKAKQKGDGEIAQVRIYEGLVSQVQFLKLTNDPPKVAWMVRPVVTHTVYYDSLHKLALKKMWQILERYEIDPKFLPQILKVAETSANRIHGPVVQKIQMAQKQEITHISGDAQSQDVTPDDPVLLEAKIREMQAKLNKTKPIEIEAKLIEDDE